MMLSKSKILLIAAIMLTNLGVCGASIEQNGLKYELDADSHTASVSYGDAGITTAVIPATVSSDGADYTVTSIADRGFFGCKQLVTITLPATIKAAGMFAFLGCAELTRVDIPTLADWLEIAFTDGFSNPLVYGHDLYVGGTLLKELVLPEGAEKVSDNAFTGASITSVKFASTITTIGSHAFYECASLTELETGSGVTSIGIQAFDGCTALKTASLTPAVTTVGNYSFNGCSSLTTVKFGRNIRTVGTDAFAGCDALGMVEAADIASWCGIDFANEGANPLLKAHVLSIDGKPVTELVIPAGITAVKEGAFAGCTAIESVVTGKDVTAIGAKAFNGCPALRSVKFEGAAATIGDYAFEGCELLSDCELPSTLTAIGKYAFYGTSLTEATVPGGVTTLPDGTFGECSRLSAVTLPEGLTSLGFGTFYGCKALAEIELPTTVQKIGKSAFYGCSGLKTVKMGNAVESLATFAFGSCPAIADIYVGAAEPPVAPENSFSTYTATLHVPQGAIAAYKADSTWGQFTNIEAYDNGVNDLLSDTGLSVDGRTIDFGAKATDSAVAIFGIDGRCIYSGAPTAVTVEPGTYIVRTAGRTVKIGIR